MIRRCGLGCVLAVFCVSGLGQAAPVVLNEYNAVKNTNYLQGTGTDCYFGRILGNGGNWFELVIVEDHVDMRNWTIDWREMKGDPNDKAGTIYLSNDSFWSNMRKGTILTIIEDPSSGGGRDTDTVVDFIADDWWLNISTVEEQSKYPGGNWLVRTEYTKGGGNAGDFTTSNDSWQMRIKNSSGGVVFGWVGEGVNPLSGVGSDEVCKLEENPSALITEESGLYNDGKSSSFGSANLWDGGAATQDFSDLRSWFAPLAGDANLDGMVNFSDYLRLCQNFGATEASWGQGDFNNDQTVNFSDYLLLIQNFGGTWGGSGVVPEPVTALITAIGGSLVGWRRRGGK